MKRAIKPEEKEAMVDMFNSLPADMRGRYEYVAKHFKRSTTACFTAVKQALKQEPDVKYFDYTKFPF